jgi:chemotaxis protein CheD
MISGETELPTIYLRTGEIYFTAQPVVIITVLGSCVSVNLFHRRLGLSAVSHGLMPHCRNQQACDGSCAESAKYVECSLHTMVDWFKRSGVALRELETGVYGGADMFGKPSAAKFTFSVGKQNIETAVNALSNEGVPVLTMDVGGTQGRKIYFNTRTGEVLLKRLQPGVVLAGAIGNNDNNEIKRI